MSAVQPIQPYMPAVSTPAAYNTAPQLQMMPAAPGFAGNHHAAKKSNFEPLSMMGCCLLLPVVLLAGLAAITFAIKRGVSSLTNGFSQGIKNFAQMAKQPPTVPPTYPPNFFNTPV